MRLRDAPVRSDPVELAPPEKMQLARGRDAEEGRLEIPDEMAERREPDAAAHRLVLIRVQRAARLPHHGDVVAPHGVGEGRLERDDEPFGDGVGPGQGLDRRADMPGRVLGDRVGQERRNPPRIRPVQTLEDGMGAGTEVGHGKPVWKGVKRDCIRLHKTLADSRKQCLG